MDPKKYLYIVENNFPLQPCGFESPFESAGGYWDVWFGDAEMPLGILGD